MNNKLYPFLFVLVSVEVMADGIKIDSVYDPYVQPLERELEWRSNFFQFDDGEDIATHKLGFGYGITSRWFAEIYAVGEASDNESLTLEAVELEAKWQLTEQGEYGADWGLLFELEDERHNDVFEFSTTLLTSKDLGRWTAITNLGAIYEWGEDIDNEFETTFSSQLRYRMQPEFEPGLELYLGQDTQGVGPVIQGTVRSSGRKSLHWEAGIIAGVSDKTPDYTVRLLMEYEF